MKMTQRDRRALMILGGAVMAAAIIWFATGGSAAPAAAKTNNIPAAETRLERVRRLAGTVEGKKQILSRVSAELGEREKGIIQAETAAQAQAFLLDIVRHTAHSQTPPIEFGSVEFQPASKLGEYGAVHVAVPFVCHIEELLNFLSDLANRPEAIAVEEMRIGAQDAKLKTIAVRLTVSGVVPRRLAPDKKGRPGL